MKNIFSTGIEVHQLEGIDNEKLIEYAEKYSLRNQLKETKDILNNKLFSTLNNLVEVKMNDYFNQIYNETHHIKLTAAWANVDNDTAITEPHTHKLHFVVAVYYPLSTDGYLTFMNPMPSLVAHQNHYMIGEFNEYNSDYYMQPVKTGQLVVFNSMLPHFIKESNNKRISIAYNGSLINGSSI